MSGALIARCAALADDIAEWRAEAAVGKPLEKHNSQLAALDILLGAPARQLKTAASEPAPDEAKLLRDAAGLERIWDVFRGRLLQRRVTRYARPLAIADAFAWCCYRPVAVKAGVTEVLARGFEPPFVSCEGLEAPDVIARGVSFAAELAGTPEILNAAKDRHAAVLRRLPVPLVGLPWGSLAHLPDLLMLAHEVGHVADADFGISAVLLGAGAASAALPELAVLGSPWRIRLREAVADVYGALASGPAFVIALEQLLGPWLANEASGQPADPLYPPARLRLRMAARALLSQHPANTADLLPAAARASLDMTNAEAVVADTLAAAIIGTKLPKAGDASLADVFKEPLPLGTGYPALLKPVELFKAMRADCGRVLAGSSPTSSDLRALLGASVLAFARDPTAYATVGAANRIMDAAERVLPIGVLDSSHHFGVMPERVSFDVLAELRGDST
jgi:hypothetical protein